MSAGSNANKPIISDQTIKEAFAEDDFDVTYNAKEFLTNAIVNTSLTLMVIIIAGLVAIIIACSLVAFAYPNASSAEVVFLGANLLSPTPFIIPFAFIKYTLSFAQEDILSSSAKVFDLVNSNGNLLSSAIVHPSIDAFLYVLVSIVAACSLFNNAFGSKVVSEVVAEVPVVMPKLNAFNTSIFLVSVNGFDVTGVDAIPVNAS